GADDAETEQRQPHQQNRRACQTAHQSPLPRPTRAPHPTPCAAGRYPRGVTAVEVFVDPSCPWAWLTSLWVKDVAPHRDLEVTWRSFCLEIRDDYGVAPTMPEERREAAIAAHAPAHRTLRIFQAARP